jgi:cytochrome oxidase assembly protein ShyY1
MRYVLFIPAVITAGLSYWQIVRKEWKVGARC